MKEMIKRHTQRILFIGLIFLLVTHLPSFAEDDPLAKPALNKDTDEKYVSIDFNNVDISVFIKFISELTGTNFIIDDSIKGKVTIISPSKISEAEAYKVFESVLEIHGFATVKAGEVVKIVSSPDARTKNIETLMSEVAKNPNDRLVTQLITLKYADPDEIKRLVAPLISKNSVMLAYEPTGTLIVTDAYSNIKRLIQIIRLIDVADVGQNISVVPLQNADAAKVAQTLDGLFKSNASRRTPRDAEKVVKFIPDERTNSIILLASEVDSNRINELIAMLDKAIPKGKDKIHVYYLENSTAEDLAKVLQSLSGKKTASADKGKKEDPIVSDKVTITADKATNSLIIMADKDEYLVIESVIKKLDIPRAMVYIECLIVEVSVNKSLSIGAEWTAGKEVTVNDRDGGAGIGFSGGTTETKTSYGKIAGISGIATNNISKFPDGFALGVVGESLKIGGVTFPNLGAVISAMQSDKDTNILSTPQLLTTNNEEASITVGSNVPYKTSSGTASTSVETYSNYDYKNVGKILKITPQISKDRQIRLKINFESTAVDTVATSDRFDTPTTSKRAIETTVIVKDNNTVVLGGLIDDQSSHNEFKVPCLGSIPIVGYLFKNMNKGNAKSNLYVFLTPHVVGDREEAAKLMNSKKDQIDVLRKNKIKLYDGTERRELKAIEE